MVKDSNQKNVFGLPLELCSLDPMTGYYRDGYCHTGPGDHGSHTVAGVISEDFLQHQKLNGNDLMTPYPLYNFPGLKPGNRWAVCASRWLQSYKAGKACKVILSATNIRALDIIPFEFLKEYEHKESED
jgi:uncharacterized protein (DUF2237 family)